jgi:ribonuclease D
MRSDTGPLVVTDERALASLLNEAAAAPHVAVDLEASGMFAYRARPCTVQLAWGDPPQPVVVDALATSIAPLGALLGADGPVKIIHDVGFDARLLGEAGIVLGNVHDTSIAARMLGRTATGLASLLGAELGITVSKALQHHDWRIRPFDQRLLAYLATDVLHLEALERKLWAEVRAAGIEDAVLEETRHRVATAVAAAAEPPSPPYTRVKGGSKLAPRELAALRVLADLREAEAARRDVTPHQVASGDALLALSRARPANVDAVRKVRGIPLGSPGERAFAESLVRALQDAPDDIPAAERAAYFDPPRLPQDVVKARRAREVRLLAWRRVEAKKRGVDEQVVLPGHCVRDAVDADVATVDALARLPGIGAFRVTRDGEAILAALRGDGAAAVVDASPATGDGAPG